MDASVPSAMSSSRRKHRKRFSLSHLSSDTTSTLPEYSSISAPWRPNRLISADRCTEDGDIASDRPPDYPQSADEADADTDDSTGSDLPPLAVSPSRQRRFRPSTPTTSSSRRRPSHTRTRSSTSSTEPYLDSLLARSVHALEMSNTLLQSSISTHSSFSSFLSSESSTSTIPQAPLMRAGDLTPDAHQTKTYNDPWADDIHSIRRRMDSLLGPVETPIAEGDEDVVSRSLPASSSVQNVMEAHAHRFRSSTDLRHKRRSSTMSADFAVTQEEPDSPVLRLSHRPPPRERLVAPPPRAVTLYVGADADPSLISLPSTLGQRSWTSFTQHAGESTLASRASSPRPSSTSTVTLPIPALKDHPEPASESSTPAFTLLSSFLSRRPSTSTTAPSTSKEPRRSRSAHPRRSPGPRRAQKRYGSDPRPDPRPPPEIRVDDILVRSSSESSASDPHTPPVRSMQALRRILDEQPAPDPPPRRKFLPRTPPPPPTLGTSSATASVSRLFTKSVHAHAAPRSALKGGSASGSGSGASTPKRIQFAALPEGHAGSGRGFEKGKRWKGKESGRRGAGAVSEGDENDGEGGEHAWWKAWLGVGGTGSERAEERVEARIARWGFGGGGRGFGGVEDWAV